MEGVEHIAFHHYEFRNAVDHYGVTQGYEVNPTAAAFATGHGSVFMAEVADGASCLVEELCGERSGTHTGAVCLENSVDVAYPVGCYAKAGTCTGSYGVGGGNVWIAAEIHVEHCALGAFAEDGFPLGKEIVDEVFTINDAVFLQVFDCFEPALFKGRKFVGCRNGVE